MVNRVLIGDYGGGTYGIRLSKPGFDVTTALDPERLAFDSSWKDGAVIYRVGTAVTGGASAEGNYLPFGETLPAYPIVYFWYLRSSTVFQCSNENTTQVTVSNYCCIRATPSGLYFYQRGDIEGGTSTWAYIVLRAMTNG